MHPSNIEADKPRHVIIDYTNYKNERKDYIILPHQIVFGKTDVHTTPCWLVQATDVNRNVIRYFDMAKIHSWKAES